MTSRPHWLFGDQLGPHFLHHRGGGPDNDATVVMIECKSVFARRRFHRATAHLVLSAMRHRAAELGDRVRYVKAGTYHEGLRQAVRGAEVTAFHPTSHAALALLLSRTRRRVRRRPVEPGQGEPGAAAPRRLQGPESFTVPVPVTRSRPKGAFHGEEGQAAQG